MVIEFTSSDFDDFESSQQGWDIHYRPLGKVHFKGNFLSMLTGGIQVDLEGYETPIEVTGSAFPSALSFAFPVSNTSLYSTKGIEVTHDHIDVYDGDACELDFVTRPDTQLLSISIPNKKIEQQKDSPLISLLKDYNKGHTVFRPDPAVVLAFRYRCLELVKHRNNDLLPEDAYKSLLDEILCFAGRILDGNQQRPTKNIRRQYLLARRARDFMLDRMKEPPTINEICAALDTPERTLYNAFSRVYGVSPKRFLKAQQLYSTRHSLKMAEIGTRISDIAIQNGFWDFGHFSKDYKEMFGELPSVTLLKHK
jgi:AraC family ethanolamine operon transcriptional activator